MENKYNFDEMTERRGTACVKWDRTPDPDMLPLWVADMDFRTASAVTEAVMKRASSGIFGYVQVPPAYYDAVCRWFDERHDWKINRDRIIYTLGVVPAVSAVIKALAAPGEGVIIQTPAYNCFFSSVKNNGCREVYDPLRRVDTADGFTYELDFEHLESLASQPDVKLLLFCNPQNPTGRVWTRGELEKVRDICHRHGVRVLSDEIHCELTHDGRKYVPYATVDEEAVVFCSPSKAFNTAGLQTSNIVCPNPEIQEKIDRAINENEVCDVNPFGVVGLMAAYNEGGEWLDALNEYLDGNYRFLCDEITTRLPKLKICRSEATYLAWIDIRALGMTSDELDMMLREKAKVRINSGAMYHGEGYIRINYACPRQRLAEALNRIVACLENCG